jgi:ABC-type glycerol-3-phosphate transport system substrate-binding protein
MEKQHLTRLDVIEASRKTMNRRDFLKLAGIAAGATVMAASAPGVVSASPLPSLKPEPVTLDVWWSTTIEDLNAPWAGPDGPEWWFGGLGRAAFNPWLQKHPGVALNITGHGWDAGLYFEQLNAIASNYIPDVTCGEAFVYEFARKGLFNPVSPAVAGMFPACTLAAALMDGKYYGVPQGSGANVLMINRDVLERCGLPTDHFPTTWDQLLTDAQQVSAANYSPTWGNNAYFGDPPYWSYGSAMRVLPWFNQNGAPLADAAGYPTANTSKAVDTWAWVKSLMATSNVDIFYNDPIQLFNEGVLAYKMAWSGDMVGMGSHAVAVPLPLPPGGKPANITVGNQINSPCKGLHQDLAIDLVEKVWTRVDVQEWLAQNAGLWIPALKSILNQWRTYNKLDAYQTDAAKAMVRLTMKELLTGNASPVPNWPNSTYPAWWEWNQCYWNIWHDGLDIKTELDTLQSALVTDIYGV